MRMSIRMSIEESSSNPSTQSVNEDSSDGERSTDPRTFPVGEHPIDNLLELLEGEFKSLDIASDYPFVFDALTGASTNIEPLSTAEMKAWLEANLTPQLLDGSYWREYSNVAIFGGVVDPGTRPGSSVPRDEYFSISICKQTPPRFRLARS